MTDRTPPRTAPTQSPSRPIYDGMAWTPVREGRLVARSGVTPSTYIAEPLGDGRWAARHGFRDAPGKPNVEIGIFADEAIAMLSCERHDFRFWRSVNDRAGVESVFMGSAERVRGYVDSLPDHEKNDILDMIAGDFQLPDGRAFTPSASFFQAVKSGMKQERNGSFTLTMSVDPGDAPLWMLQTAPGARLVLGAVDLGGGDDDEWRERGANALRRCFALERDNTFHGWMANRYDRWGLIRTAMGKTSTEVETAVSETLRRVIGCPSRRDLATNRDAVMRLEKMDREFYLDLSRGFNEAA